MELVPEPGALIHMALLRSALSRGASVTRNAIMAHTLRDRRPILPPLSSWSWEQGGTGSESTCAIVIRNDAPAERSDDGTGRVFGSFFARLGNRWSWPCP